MDVAFYLTYTIAALITVTAGMLFAALHLYFKPIAPEWSAIGEAQKMWPHGSELAFTLIPNFLMTGIAAMIVGLAIIIWSLGFVHKKNEPVVFILLFIKILPLKIREPLGKLWLRFLIISSALLVFVLEIGVTGFVPGMSDPDVVLTVMLICLASEVVILPVTFIAGFAHDIAMKPIIARGDK